MHPAPITHTHPLEPLQPLHDNRRRRTTTVTDGSHTLFTLLQSMHKRHDNSATRRSDGLRVFSRQFSDYRQKKRGRRRHTWPRATAPPLTLTLDLSRPSTLSAATPTTEKASLNSQRAISSFDTPAFLRARGTARVGAVGKSMGAQAASAKPVQWIRFGIKHAKKKKKKPWRWRHTENLGKRFQTLLLNNLARRQNDGGSTVVEG